MFKLQNQFKIISLLFIFLVFLFIVDKNIYALPGINLDVRKNQLEEEKNSLLQQLTNTFNNTILNSQTRLNRMFEISERLDVIYDEIKIINQQIINRNQYNNQRQSNSYHRRLRR
jgi:hypothetical protein